MAYMIVDPADFMTDGVFFEDAFIERVNRHDWSRFAGKSVLVRGCESALIPPWGMMLITGKLADTARSVRYGNEHDNVVVYRRDKENG